MIQSFKRLFARPTAPAHAIPPGERVYAVGDIHGRLDLFDELLALIDADDAAREPAETTLVLLGDLIDRGPDSFGVIERARALMASGNVRIIAGNHEEMMIASMASRDALRGFLQFGGRETLLSYPIEKTIYNEMSMEELHAHLPALVPQAHVDFIGAMEDQVRIGDYLFVHAGIRPQVPLEQQRTNDLRWIRREFLDSREDHGVMVVHGHTIGEDVVERPNRIGIDTGAFQSGVLTAVGLEGTERWYLKTESTPAAAD